MPKIWDETDRFYWDQWFARNSVTPHHRMREEAWREAKRKNAEALAFYKQRERFQREQMQADAAYEWRHSTGTWDI